MSETETKTLEERLEDSARRVAKLERIVLLPLEPPEENWCAGITRAGTRCCADATTPEGLCKIHWRLKHGEAEST